MSEADKNSKTLSDAIWVIALTAASYFISFSYESGYASFFNIPISAISISPTLLLTTASALLISIIPVYAISHAVFIFLPRSETILSKKIRSTFYQILFASLFLSPHLIHNNNWHILAFAIAFVVFFDYIFPIIVHRKKIPYEEKLRIQENINRNSNSFTLTDKAVQRFGRAPVFFLSLTLAASSISNALGNENAKSKEYFLKIKGKPDTIVLQQFDNTFITQTVDTKSRKLTGFMKITRIGDGKEIEFSPEKIGPIMPQNKINEFFYFNF